MNDNQCACGVPVEDHLTHYIIVRRDLPLGVVLAQVTHAAGESYYKFAHVAQQKERESVLVEHRPIKPKVAGSNPAVGSISFPGSSEKEHDSLRAGVVAGSSPAPGAIFNPNQTYAIVLGARNEHRLLKLERALVAANVLHVAVREPDEPYNGALMAIGLVPANAHELRPHLSDFHMLRELDTPKDKQ